MKPRNQKVAQGTSHGVIAQPPRQPVIGKTRGLNPARPIPLFSAHQGSVAKSSR
jgi:hypothetical protein